MDATPPGSRTSRQGSLGHPLGRAGEAGLSAGPELSGGVDQDDLVPADPAKEPSQQVGVLMPAAGFAGEEVLEGGGGDLGPTGQASAGHQLMGEVAQDPQPGRQGDVAELVSPGAPVLVAVLDLGEIERDDCSLQRCRYGLEVSLPAGRCPPLFDVVREGEAVAGEERGERARG